MPATRRCRSPSCRSTSCATTAAARSGRRTGRPGWIRSTGRPSTASRTAAWKRCSDELGPLQVLAAALQVRFRAEVAGRHFDDAIRTAKTMFALARHLGEHPTEVADLVGLWVAHLGLGTLEEMVQQPGCPNLYWALTDLPCPLVDLRKGVQGDRTLVAADLRSLRDDAPMTDAEIGRVREPLVRRAGFRTRTGGPAAAEPASPAASDGSRTRSGCAPPAGAWSRPGYAPDLGQDVPAHAGHPAGREARLRDPAGRAHQAPGPAALADRRAGRAARTEQLTGTGCSPISCPTSIKLRRTQGQLEQQIALLRHVEALRLYAAEHDGKLPAKLSDISVPLPIDPVTGKPFVYAVDGATAHIRGGSLTGERANRDPTSTTR